jgi:Protein of unknown function (DUF3987)
MNTPIPPSQPKGAQVDLDLDNTLDTPGIVQFPLAEAEDSVDETHPFPVELHYEPIRSYVIDIAQALNIPCALPAVASLGSVAASLGKRLEIQTGPELIVRGNLFLIAAAKSGTGKTIGTRHLLKPVWSFQDKNIQSWKEENAPNKTRRGILELQIKQLEKQCASSKAKNADDDQLELDEQELTQKYAELDTLNEKLLIPLFGNSNVSGSLPGAGQGHQDKQPEATRDAPGQYNGVVGPANANAETPQQRLATALNGEDQELIRLFLLNRKVCTDGLIESVAEDYANRALQNLPRFRERLAQFATQPF